MEETNQIPDEEEKVIHVQRTKKEQKQIELFIKQSKKLRKKFRDGLIRSATAEDQGPTRSLRSAIYSINNTIAALQEGTKNLDQLKKYHIHVFLPFKIEDPEIEITYELTQKKGSHPLPLGYFIQIQPPIVEPAQTEIIKQRNLDLKYQHTFNFGERNIYTVIDLQKSDTEFKIYQRTNILGKVKDVLKAIATVSLAPLSYSTNVTAPLYFSAIDGTRTHYAFDVRLIESSPLAAPEDLNIDEDIYVFEVVNDENVNV